MWLVAFLASNALVFLLFEERVVLMRLIDGVARVVGEAEASSAPLGAFVGLVVQ